MYPWNPGKKKHAHIFTSQALTEPGQKRVWWCAGGQASSHRPGLFSAWMVKGGGQNTAFPALLWSVHTLWLGGERGGEEGRGRGRRTKRRGVMGDGMGRKGGVASD